MCKTEGGYGTFPQFQQCYGNLTWFVFCSGVAWGSKPPPEPLLLVAHLGKVKTTHPSPSTSTTGPLPKYFSLLANSQFTALSIDLRYSDITQDKSLWNAWLLQCSLFSKLHWWVCASRSEESTYAHLLFSTSPCQPVAGVSCGSEIMATACSNCPNPYEAGNT